MTAPDPHSLLSSAHASTCVLELISRHLGRAFAAQTLRYRAGNFSEIPCVGALAYLHRLTRTGICPATAVLDKEELPSLEPLLQQLPDDLRIEVEAAIAAELRGECIHETRRVLLQVEELAQGLHTVGELQQQTQPAHSAM